jgi:excisionase family DNA binding protein|tara:strand:+ start:23685 stop:23879 length:195 start_codon:yes stop_codon:yes gene_type:complete
MNLFELPILVRPEEAAGITGLSQKQLARLAKVNALRLYRTVGNHRRYYRDDLIKHLKGDKNGNN